MSLCVLRAHFFLSLKNIALYTYTRLFINLLIKGHEHISYTYFTRFIPSITPKYFSFGGAIKIAFFKISNFYCLCRKIEIQLTITHLSCNLQPVTLTY